MSWIRLHPDIGRNPKFLDLHDLYAGLGVYVLILGYCHTQRTDGRISERVARRLWPDCLDELADLERVGLLERDGELLSVHDYLDWQQSAEEIQAASEKGRMAAQARWNARSNAGSNATNKQASNLTRASATDCGRCGGRGLIGDDDCTECNGTGKVFR